MAPQPKKKLSKIRRGLRQATQVVKLPVLVKCANCGEAKLPNTVCKACGKYKDLQVQKKRTDTKVTRAQ